MYNEKRDQKVNRVKKGDGLNKSRLDADGGY